MLKWLILILALLPLPAAATDVDALYAELQSGNLRGAAHHIAELYEEAGASWDVSVDWKLDAYTRMFNYYDPIYEFIEIGAIPKPGEVEAYWQNWSDLLTEGRWQPATFFRDPDEAAMLASYNQFVLAAHEAGHALKYRYELFHYDRHLGSINCREFYADILAAGLLHTLSAADRRFSELQSRYVALLGAINAEVAPGLRYPPVTFAALDDNCATAMTVDQPTPERMAAYASAYFVRQAVMLGGDMPALPALVEKHLIAYRDAEVKIPYLEPPVPVETVGYIAGFEFSDDQPTGTFRFHQHDIPAPTSGGEVYLVRFETNTGDGEEPGPIRYSLSYGRPGGELRTLATDQPFGDEPVDDFMPLAAAATDDDNFVLLVRAKGDLLVSRYQFAGGQWGFGVTAPIPNLYDEAVLARTAAGRLFVLAGPKSERDGTGNSGWIAFELDPLELTLKSEQPLPPLAGEPRSIDDAGNVYGAYLNGIARTAPDGTAAMLAGSDLTGHRDAPGRLAEFSPLWLSHYASTLQVTTAGDLVVIDTPRVEIATTLRRLDLP